LSRLDDHLAGRACPGFYARSQIRGQEWRQTQFPRAGSTVSEFFTPAGANFEWKNRSMAGVFSTPWPETPRMRCRFWYPTAQQECVVWWSRGVGNSYKLRGDDVTSHDNMLLSDNFNQLA
jgi:hypothetical protein